MADNKYNVRPTGPGDLAQYKRFSDQDSNLIESFNINSTFNSQKNVAELHIYTSGNSLLRSISNYTNYKIQLNSGGSNEGSTSIYVDPAQDAISYGYNNGGVKLLYLFFDNLFSESKLGLKLYVKEISNDRTELKLSSTGILNEDLKKYSSAIKDRIEDTSFFSEFRLNFGNNNLYIGINIDYNDEENAVVVKLYEPLPVDIDIKSTLDISEFVSDPISYEVEAEFTPDAPAIPRLREANFNLELEENTATPSQFFNYDELFSYSVDNSNYQVFSLFNEKGAELSIDHSNYEDFIHFSSAEERLINFKYKLDLLNNYSASIQNINTELGSSGVTSDKSHYENLIEGIVNNFDHYERFLYFESGSYSWPKSNNQKPYANQASSTAEAITWFADQRTAANNYDVSNFNALTNTIPSFIREDDNNAQYTLFVQMIAQHFDNLWIYSKAVSDKYNADNRVNVGVSRDLVEEAIKSLGVKLYNSSDSLQDLFKYFVGEFSKETDEVINQNVQAGNIVTGEDEVIVQQEVGLKIDISSAYTRVGVTGPSYVMSDLIPRFGNPPVHPFADPELNIQYSDRNLNAAQIQRRFKTGFKPTLDEIKNNLDNHQRIIFAAGEKPANVTITNPENIQGFDLREKVSYYFTFTLPERTHPFTGEVVPAATHGPFRYHFRTDLPIYPFNLTSRSQSNILEKGFFNTFPANPKNAFEGFIKQPYLDINAIDLDGKDLRNIFLPGMSRDTGDLSRSVTRSGTMAADDFQVSITITDESNRVITTTETVETKTLKPFDTLPKDLYQKSVYKRIYHNLPFLLKTKGTQRGLRALINCFGIPYNIMKIRTSGGRLNSERPFFGTELQSSLETSNVRTDNNDTIISGSTLSQFTTITKSEDTYNQDLHNIEVGFSPSDNLNTLISNTLGSTFNVDDYIGDPRDLTAESYNGLLAQVKTALADVTEKYDVKDFIRLIRFFDNVIFKMIKDFVPARSTVDTGVVIKPHLLDRSKAKSVVVSLTQPEYSGSISVGEYSGSSGGIFKGSATGSNDINGNPIPVNIEGEYDTAYTTQILTPEGLRVKNFESITDHNSEQAKYDGELQGSGIKLSDGELNKANTLKQIKYPTVKYNVRFLNEPPLEVCFLNDQLNFIWKVKEEDYQNTDTTAGNELIIQSLFGAASSVEQIFLNGSTTQLQETDPDGSDSTVFSTVKHFNPPQYGDFDIEARNSLVVESSSDTDDDQFCNGRVNIQFVRCALSSKKSDEYTITVNPNENNYDLIANLFNGANVNYDFTIKDPASNYELSIPDPTNYNFEGKGYTEGQIITFTIFDNINNECKASATVKFSACALEATPGEPADALSEDRYTLNLIPLFVDNTDTNGNNIADYYVSLYYNKILTKEQVTAFETHNNNVKEFNQDKPKTQQKPTIPFFQIPGTDKTAYLVPYDLSKVAAEDIKEENFGEIISEDFIDADGNPDLGAELLGITKEFFIKIKNTDFITSLPIIVDNFRTALFNTVPDDLKVIKNEQNVNIKDPLIGLRFQAIDKNIAGCRAYRDNHRVFEAPATTAPTSNPLTLTLIDRTISTQGDCKFASLSDVGLCDYSDNRDPDGYPCFGTSSYFFKIKTSPTSPNQLSVYCNPGIFKLKGEVMYSSFKVENGIDTFENPAKRGRYLYNTQRSKSLTCCKDEDSNCYLQGKVVITVGRNGIVAGVECCVNNVNPGCTQ